MKTKNYFNQMAIMFKMFCAVLLLGSLVSCGATPPTQYDGWELVWNDEFNNDGKPDSDSWSFEQGFVRNNELQWYQEDNANCKDGLLTIEGRKEKFENPNYKSDSKSWRESRSHANYTASSIKTIGKREFLYGRFEVKAKIPTASGSWPAIWTLGQNKGWPACGEIDLMEYYQVGGKPHILANAAWEAKTKGQPKWDGEKIPFSEFLEKNPNWANEFHVWRMDWDQEYIRLYLDDELLNTIELSKTVNANENNRINPFKTPHYVLLNLAMGSNGGKIDESALPLRYEVDYVRVYQKIKKPHTSFKPGAIWEDTAGEHINAHGGGIMHHNDTYYWYGEHKSEHTSEALVGVNVYSSKDLYNWKKEAVALSVDPVESGSKIESGCIIERPKVIYNKKHDNFVMWFHLELKGQGYKAANYGVAVSDTPVGPFKFLYAGRSCPDVWPNNMTPEQIARAKAQGVVIKDRSKTEQCIIDGVWLNRDLAEGQMSRDMTLYVDDDDKAYHIFSAEENHTLHIAELTEDYLYHTDNYSRVLPSGHNEAPSIFKKDGIYWMITSGCTGWAPNPARLSKSTSVFGPWEPLPNPCVGDKVATTFDSQSTHIQPVIGKDGEWIFMADRWRPENPIDARYVWLPIQFKDGVPYLEWQDEWSISDSALATK